jgi:tRNA (guanosine-2'-O-)-methyltransferase
MASTNELLFHHLARFVSDHKKEFIDKILNDRTRYVTVVLENIYQSQNASAVLRTCECMGVQDVHVVENTARYQLNVRVLKGSDKWLSIHRYRDKHLNNTEQCFRDLREKGYRIMVADPSPDGVSIEDVDFTQDRTALVFGNELNGASAYAIESADQKITIPMYGFTESLNLSVSVAISLTTVLRKIRQWGGDIYLSEQEKQMLKLMWYRKIVKRSEILEREFLRTIQ